MGGKTSAASINKYIAKAYDRVNLTLPKGQKEVVQAHATARSESVNGFIGRAIVETMERDGAQGHQQAAEATQGAGVVSLPSETLETAQRAAEDAGEATEQFISRAVETQARRDERSLQMGLNPVTGKKLEQNGKGDGDETDGT